MIRFQILLALSLVACAPVTPEIPASGVSCITPCGAWTREGNCEELQRLEHRIVVGFSEVVHEWPAEQICAALRGWEIRVHKHDPERDVLCPERAWQHWPGFCVWGYTWVDRRVIEVSSSQWDHTALVHEVGHAAGYVITHDDGHCRWGDPKFRAVIERLQGTTDLNRPEASCSR